MLTALRRAGRSLPLAVRSDDVELLDSRRLSLPEVERNLLDLARLNRLPGGTGASVDGVRRVLAACSDASVLDVGTGSGDMPIAFARNGWTVTAVDTHANVLRIVRRSTAGEPRIRVVEADARSMPFEDGTFDVAHSSLLMHHLDPLDAVIALREMRRVARYGVVINDLRRGALPLLATAVSVAALGRSRVTLNDGLVSALRAYTLDELDRIIERAGLAVRWRSTPWMPRIVSVASAQD